MTHDSEKCVSLVCKLLAYFVSHLYWALERVCEILVFMWSLGALQFEVLAGPYPLPVG